jgi:hypothetical protein
MDELHVGCNNMLAMNKGIHDQVGCQCDCVHVCQHEEEGGGGECQASIKFYISFSKIWEEVICPKGLYIEWHQQECLLRQCILYGES